MRIKKTEEFAFGSETTAISLMEITGQGRSEAISERERERSWRKAEIAAIGGMI